MKVDDDLDHKTLHPEIAQTDVSPRNIHRERDLPFHLARLNYSGNGNVRYDYDRAVASTCYMINGYIKKLEYSEIVNHYTKWEAVSSIVRTKELWASHYSGMNDFKEVSHAWQMLSAAAAKLLQPKEGWPEFFRAAEQAITTGCDLYLVSFSKRRNLLSQWRAYGWPGGVSMGFPACMFTGAAAEAGGYQLKDVIYDPREQTRVLQPLVERLAALMNAAPDPAALASSVLQIKSDFWKEAPFLKNPGFAEEAEVRLVSDGRGCDIFERRGSYGPVKYIKISLQRSFELTPSIDFPIWSVVTAPSQSPDAEVQRAAGVFNDNQTKFASISDSGISLR